MELTNASYDVFISYHGGNTDGTSSSYKKAIELKQYFENHPNKKLKCFLCKDEKRDDFYDAINNALAKAKHFILVACDRKMLSEWVSDELKQFDGLRKIGKKPNAVINSYIFGTITVDDLLNFNTVFSTKDIAFGDRGFESLYNMIIEKENIQSKTLCFEYPTKTISKFIYTRPMSHRFNTKLHKYLSMPSVPLEVTKKFNDDITAFEAKCSNQLSLSLSKESETFIFLRVFNPLCVAKYLSSFEHIKNLNFFILNYQSTSAALLVDGSPIAIPSLCDIQIVFADEVIKIDVDETTTPGTVLFNTNQGELELPTTDYNEFSDIICYEKETNEINWQELQTNIPTINFCLYLLNSLHDHIVPKNTFESEELFDEIDLCTMDITSPYIPIEIEKEIIEQKKNTIVQHESLLWDYYRSIKSGKKFGEQETKNLFSSKYADIAYDLKKYYTRHSVDILLDVLHKLYNHAITEKEQGFFSKYEYLIMMLAEIHLHNIFILDYQFMIDCNIYNTLVNLHSNEYITINKNKLQALICSYRKEIYFCGKFDQLQISGPNIHEVLLKEFQETISVMENSSPNLEENEYKFELILLYRERCVIWEHCGDMTLKQSERKLYYTNWRDDCNRALEIGDLVECDKELQGCIYLNLASSINRLSVYDNDKKLDMLNECLKHLDTALQMFKICATDRYIAYAYLHKSDCYEAILNENILQQGKYDLTTMSHIVDEIRRNSTHALNLFKNTTDDIAKCWATRLSVKGKILNASNYGSPETLKGCLKILREALRYCMSSNYVNGMAACVKDFTFYNDIIMSKKLQNEMKSDIEQTFFDEMLVFASIIKLLNLDMEDIIDVQQELEKLVQKLID